MPFKKGRKKTGGKQKGSKNKKTLVWKALSESITGGQAEKFQEFMDELWDRDKQDRMKAAELFLKTLDFFLR